jgi:hypothetical protein
MYAAIIKAGGDFYLMCDSESKSITGWKSLEEALESFEGVYDEFHKRNYESSMSATLNWLFYQPSIIPLIEKDIPTLFTSEELTNIKMTTLRNVSGRMSGVKLTKESSINMWETGTKPKLLRGT